MLAFFFVSLAGFVQEEGAVPPTSFDRVFELELTADDPALIDGRGPTAVVEVEVEFSGTLHLWTRSELDLFLHVEDPMTGSLLAQDGDSGGGTTPYAELTVQEGDYFAVLVASKGSSAVGALSLHAVAAPETDATRETAPGARARLEEARRVHAEGDPEAARRLLARAAHALAAAPGVEHSEVLSDLSWDLGFPTRECGDLQTSRETWTRARNHRERTLPEGHPDLVRARTNLAATMREMGDLPGARLLQEAVLAAYERTLHEDHPDLLAARQNLALTMADTGDLPGARALQEAVLAAREKSLPADHPDLLATRHNLADTVRQVGDLPGARALEEAVLVAREQSLPADHPDLLAIRHNLALTMAGMGDLPGARALQEAVLAAYEVILPEGHPDLLRAQGSLANTMRQMGDLPGARALQEAILVASERTLPEGHPELFRARHNLANTMAAMGDLPGARALQEAVLAAREQSLPAGHPELFSARHNLAHTMAAMGDLPGARALQEAVLTAREQSLPAGHPRILRAQHNLAATMRQAGDLPGARALLEVVLATREHGLPPDHPHLLLARHNLAGTMADMGDLPGARALVPAQVAGIQARVLGSLALAPRQAAEAVRAEGERLAGACFLTRTAEPALRRSVFELLETLRMVAGEAARALGTSGDPEVVSILEEARIVRAALNDRASGAGGTDAAELTRLMQERDRLEREASRLLAEKGVAMEAVEVEVLVKALGPRDAFLGFRRVAHWGMNEATGCVEVGEDHLIAHTVAGDSMKRVDLGPASALEGLVSAWRVDLGAPLVRGVALSEEEGGDMERKTGEALRARLLDPVLEELGEEIERLFVCADDLVFLVPLDALPLAEGRVGDRWNVANEVSCARLLSSDPVDDDRGGLLALGGVDYDADDEGAATSEASSSRSALPDRFSKLLQTRIEAETAGLLFEDLLEVEPVVLTRKEATKDALFEHAPGKRYLHLATHGWFASETIKSTMDEDAGGGDRSRIGLQESVTGMAPMLLCGLALAGANNPIDSLGRRPGILTAEELCSLDLSACELAVLSACETNVGIRRAGQGIQSLQAALYAAGARSSITSLWKVDDAATRRLMEVFYTKLWEEGQPKAEALWEAKKVLRDDGAPVRDWGGWVLTGDPE